MLVATAQPALLLAVIVLYILGPSVANLIVVLAITRIPVYLRTTRAEVMEVRERMFVQAAQVMGASPARIVFRHILPMVIPTLADTWTEPPGTGTVRASTFCRRTPSST